MAELQNDKVVNCRVIELGLYFKVIGFVYKFAEEDLKYLSRNIKQEVHGIGKYSTNLSTVRWCPLQQSNIILNIASITHSSNTAAYTLLVNIDWQVILLFLLFSPWYVLILVSYAVLYIKQSWLLNVNAPLETWFGK